MNSFFTELGFFTLGFVIVFFGGLSILGYIDIFLDDWEKK